MLLRANSANGTMATNQPTQASNRVSAYSQGGPVTTGVRLSPLEYELEGTMSEIFMSDPGELREAVQAEFKVFVRDCAWLIILTEKDSTGKPVRMREIGSTNGNEIVDLEYPASASPNSASAQPRSSVIATVVIMSNSVPVALNDRPIAAHLWLMFASRCFLENAPTNRLTPVYSYYASTLRSPRLKLDAEWRFMDHSKSFPREVIYYRNDATNAAYSVGGTTEVDGVVFPSSFTFAEYEVKGPAITDLWERKHADVVVTKVRTECSRANLLPESLGYRRVVVNDLRLNHADNPITLFSYVNQTDHWLSPDAGQAISTINPSGSALGKAVPRQRQRWVFLVLLCTLVPVPVLILWKTLQRKAGTPKT